MVKPNAAIWERVNAAILGENAAEVIATLIGGMTAIVRDTGVTVDEMEARAYLAAIALSPDTGEPGSLLPLLPSAIDALRR